MHTTKSQCLRALRTDAAGNRAVAGGTGRRVLPRLITSPAIATWTRKANAGRGQSPARSGPWESRCSPRPTPATLGIKVFAAAHAGHVAVLLGSTQKMGVVSNVQALAIAAASPGSPVAAGAPQATRRADPAARQPETPEVQLIRYSVEQMRRAFVVDRGTQGRVHRAGDARPHRRSGHGRRRRHRVVLRRGQGVGPGDPLVLDPRPPGMDGWELTDRLRSRYPRARSPSPRCSTSETTRRRRRATETSDPGAHPSCCPRRPGGGNCKRGTGRGDRRRHRLPAPGRRGCSACRGAYRGQRRRTPPPAILVMEPNVRRLVVDIGCTRQAPGASDLSMTTFRTRPLIASMDTRPADTLPMPGVHRPAGASSRTTDGETPVGDPCDDPCVYCRGPETD